MRKNTCRAFSGPAALLALLFAPLCSHRHSPHQLGWKFWHNQIMMKLWVKNFEAVSESLFLPLNFLFHLFAIEILINSTCLCFQWWKKSFHIDQKQSECHFCCLFVGRGQS